MRRIRQLVPIAAAALLLNMLTVGRFPVVAAEPVNAPSLVISQLKMTSSNGQFITLYNATDTTLDMGRFQLEYFNSYDLTKATTSKLISLSGTVPPHGYYMVNDSALLLCFQLTVNSISLGLSSTAGMLEVIGNSQTGPGLPVATVVHDYVGWSKTPVSGAQTLPSTTNAFLMRQPSDSKSNPLVISAGAGSWQAVQPDPANPCGLITAAGTSSLVQTGFNQLLPPSEPPATIVSLNPSDSGLETVSGIPAGDIGLQSPSISELLPNPEGTGNDSTDEYIELYNPNNVEFDLSGFRLQTGTTTPRSYTFPAGTMLPAKGFKAFYSEQTGLSLSNTGSQAKLLDPLGNSLAVSGQYANAKDGQAWALANGKWYWTTSLTPNAANVIKQPVPAKKNKSVTSTSKFGHKTTAKLTSGKTGQTAIAGTVAGVPSETPIHTKALALVVGLALLYGAYEYRADLANRIYQFRRYFGARRADRP